MSQGVIAKGLYIRPALIKFLWSIVPESKNIESKTILNIYKLDRLGLYRGWRHSILLPTKGQRTWSNGKSAKKTNNLLRSFKVKLANKVYGNIPSGDILLGVKAEQVNTFWKNQWESEWLKAKKKRASALRKGKGLYKIDLKVIASGEVRHKEEKSKKKKSNNDKNSFVLGFERGFTKSLLKIASTKGFILLKKYLRIQIVTSSSKSTKLKKANKQKKKNKTVVLKKKKSTVWD